MTKTYILFLKDTNSIFTYSSLTALCEAHGKEELGVSKFTLDRRDFGVDDYENEKIRIILSLTKSIVDVRNEKQKFL